MVNEVSCPEVEQLMEAFRAMSTVVKASNMNLRSGDLDVAEKNCIDALILFEKLGNDRGVRLCPLFPQIKFITHDCRGCFIPRAVYR